MPLDRGLAQRGGSVKAHIRLGEVYAPMIPRYTAQGILSLEIQETFGYVDYINEDTVRLSDKNLSGWANIYLLGAGCGLDRRLGEFLSVDVISTAIESV